MDPIVTTGTVVSGRYRALRVAWPSSVGPVWQARDGVLERDVLLFTLASDVAGSAEVREALVAAATRSASLVDPSVSQIYDCSTDPPYLVSELPAGGRLAERIADKPLPLRDAARVVGGVGAALRMLHERGIAHGMIGPAWVGMDEEGRGKLLGTGMADVVGVAAAVRGAAPEPPPIPSGYPADGADPARDDVRCLAALAFHMLSGKPPARDVTLARAKLPAPVAEAIERGIAGEASLREIVAAFSGHAAPTTPADREPGFIHTEGRWLAGMVIAIAVAVAVAIAALAIVKTQSAKKASPTPTARASAAPIRVVNVTAFDPLGDGHEHDDQAARTIDGDASSSWFTLNYASADFGHAKPGLGLIFDLGSPRRIGRITIRSPYPGWQAEWRAADTQASSPDGYTTVASFTAQTSNTVAISTSTPHQYWLLWITKLADTGNGSNLPFQAAVAQVQFFA